MLAQVQDNELVQALRAKGERYSRAGQICGLFALSCRRQQGS